MHSSLSRILAFSLTAIVFTTALALGAPTQSLRSGGYFCGTDGSCQFYKPGDPDWAFERFTYLMGYSDCASDISNWRTKSPECRIVLYTSGTDMPGYKSYSSNSYLFGRKSTYVRDRMVELGDIEEHAYMHFYDDTKIRNWNGEGWDTVLIPGTYSMTVTAGDSVSRVINSYVNYLFMGGVTYGADVRLSPNFTNDKLRLAYVEFIAQAFNSQMSTHWPSATGYWDGIYFDNYSPLAMQGGNLVSGGHIVETGTGPGDLLVFGTNDYRDWGWEWMKVFGRQVHDTLATSSQWSADNKHKYLAYNIGISHRDSYLDPNDAGADAINAEFAFDPVYCNNNSYFRMEYLHTRDSTAVENGVTFFWCARPRTSYGNGSIDKRRSIYNNLCFYYTARTDSTWIYMRPEPGNAYGLFLNGGFDTLSWIPAMEYDIGRPAGHYQLVTSGSSPDESGATYKIWVRNYDYGKVYMRPRDGFDARWGETSTPIEVDLGGTYRQLLTDGSLGPVISSVSLRGADGAIVIPYLSGECVEPPTIPNLASPSLGATVTSITPTLCAYNSISPDCSQPLRYHFQVSSNSSFSVIVAEAATVPEGGSQTCWQVGTSLDPGATYYWRVRANNGLTSSQWSATGNFVCPNDPPTVPQLSSPAAGGTVTSTRPSLVILNSTDPEGATVFYHFQVSSSSGFSPIVAENSHVDAGPSTTTWQVTNSLTNYATYYWRVRASDGIGYSNWSTARSFYVNQTTVNNPPTAPTLSSPAYATEVSSLPPTLRVNNSTDDDGDPLTYQFEIYDSTFGSLIEQSGMIAPSAATTSWTVSTTLQENNKYWWRARAYDSQDWSSWMPLSYFTTIFDENEIPSMPCPISPVDGDTVVGSFHILAIENSVDGDGDQLTYDFRVFSDASLTKQVELATFVPQGMPYTIYYTTAAYANDRPYYWRVRANDGTVWTNWCDPQQFWHLDMLLDVQDAPMIVSPEDGARVSETSPTLTATWSGAADSVIFLFEVAEDQNFSTLVGLGSVIAQDQVVDWQLEAPLQNDRVYYWRVRKSDGGYSQAASFTVTAPIYASPNPFSYLDGNLTIHNVPDGATLEVYTAAGDKVIEMDSAGGDFVWDVRNSNGEKLGSGVYLYYVNSGEERFSGKFIVVR